MFGQLADSHLRQIHKRINLIFRSFKVLNAESIDRDHFDTYLIAYLKCLINVS